jgi:hypothetical protein
MSNSASMPPRSGEEADMGEPDSGAEVWLQEVVAKSPGMLEDDKINCFVLRPWLLIGREMPVSPEDAESRRWALDHLFLDQNAVPILVEVKRSSNNDLRRKVVGQILDYAASAVAQWSGETIHAQFKKTWAERGGVSEREFRRVCGAEVNREYVWQQAETNLRTRKIRLAVVASTIPSELCRIVEFLNAEMAVAKMMACEIADHEVEGKKTQVPRVVNLTVVVEREKSSPARAVELWDEPSFFATLASNQEEEQAARRILEWARERSLHIQWGERGNLAAYLVEIKRKGEPYTLITVRGRSTRKPFVEMQFNKMKTIPPFDDASRHEELGKRWNSIPGVRDQNAPYFRNADLSALRDDAALEKLFDTIEWMVQEIKTA